MGGVNIKKQDLTLLVDSTGVFDTKRTSHNGKRVAVKKAMSTVKT